MPFNYRKPLSTLNPLQKPLINNLPDEVAVSLGSGFSLPLTCSNGLWKIKNGISKCSQDIFVTLMTPIGKHFNQVDFGSLLPYLIFQRWDTALQNEIYQEVLRALQVWNTNITVNTVTLDATNIDTDNLKISINFTVNLTNVTEDVTIELTESNTTQFPPSDFSINGIPVFKASLRKPKRV
jgi:phage baseplate assembly protein W